MIDAYLQRMALKKRAAAAARAQEASAAAPEAPTAPSPPQPEATAPQSGAQKPPRKERAPK